MKFPMGDDMKRDDIVWVLRRYKESNRRKYGIRKMGFFGSAARGAIFPDSDLDVVVELEKQDLFHLIGIKQDLEAAFSQKVDIVSYRERMNDFLKKRIDQEAIYV